MTANSRESIRSVLIIGSGPIKIAEAAEFDYSGTQALKAVKEEGIRTILVNPNVATIQTSHIFADRVYLVPLKVEFVEKVIERERPDGIMIGFGGQTALSLGVELWRRGVLDRYGVKVLGTPMEGIEAALDRDKFKELMSLRGIPVPPSRAAYSPEEAIDIALEIGFPVIVRVSFNLGGSGSFVAWSLDEMRERIYRAFANAGLVKSVLVEKYLHFWKEVEYEIMRDRKDNAIAIACMENMDPMGVHTGESIVVAPCQTLTDRDYQLGRDLSIAVARAIGLVGECNVQVALSPRSEEAYVIETNPRMSRSSALASKATGYPLAYIAAKLALGYTLDELLNKVTGRTSACFEPSLDYVVVKIPRWDLQKFDYVDRSIGSEMMSVGEVMAIGRTLEEALQKAIRMLDIGEPGVVGGPTYEEDVSIEEVLEKLRKREPYWPLWAARAFKEGLSVDDLYEITGIDRFFLNVVKRIVDVYEKLREFTESDLENMRPELLQLIGEAKRLGFSDTQIARALKTSERKLRELRKRLIEPVVKQIDTLAAEWPAQTNYLYLTYGGDEDDISFRSERPKIIVLGAGGFRIGVSVEFDWATVNYTYYARELGYEVMVVNYNPETVSTDWDMNEKLYFDEITLERVLDIYEKERPIGVVTFVGGQIANNLAKKLEDNNVPLIGTKGRNVDRAEDREKFSKLLDKLGIKQPPWISARSIEEVLRFAEEVGYPVIVRPSYVLSGSAMAVAYNKEELLRYLRAAVKVSPEHPAVVSKFIDEAIEAEIDGVSDGGRHTVGIFNEHIEHAGIHSGDAMMVIPTFRLGENVLSKMRDIAVTLAKELEIRGPFNIQYLVKDDDVYVIELNLRASRSMPFASKAKGINLMKLAVEATLGGGLRVDGEFYEPPSTCWAVKSPQFSWIKLRRAYPYLGPEMRSTGEVASLGENINDALLKSWLSTTPSKIPEKTVLVYTYYERASQTLTKIADTLSRYRYVITVEDSCLGYRNNIETYPAEKILNMMMRGDIDLVVTSGYTPDKDYRLRRTAIDLNIPVILHHDTARAITEALTWYWSGGRLTIYEMSEYWRS
ncbi:MAG: carbamoyl-phosphate synthase (glutamine-hydrolyzing) large subunit [Crenarchaeota archaeon]|nr:carbamoyl-phosphate synthase (glutamine-hydrolyzing) large subunit [Thermoproteota archaeon]